jgi:hypothetical protein
MLRLVRTDHGIPPQRSTIFDRNPLFGGRGRWAGRRFIYLIDRVISMDRVRVGADKEGIRLIRHHIVSRVIINNSNSNNGHKGYSVPCPCRLQMTLHITTPYPLCPSPG